LALESSQFGLKEPLRCSSVLAIAAATQDLGPPFSQLGRVLPGLDYSRRCFEERKDPRQSVGRRGYNRPFKGYWHE
jgi:hypothetical protein